jgi:tyrosyl-tRNA synthetase
MAEHFIFPERETIIIKRPEKFGGNLDLSQPELLNMYSAGELHPLDLKNAVADHLVEILEPVRNYLSSVS